MDKEPAILLECTIRRDVMNVLGSVRCNKVRSRSCSLAPLMPF